MGSLHESLARVAAEHRYSGVVRVDRSGRTELAESFGFAERPFPIPNTLDTQFGVASACKGLTALTVVSLVDEGRLGLDKTARSILGEDLPEIGDAVTVEHLLAHRSGIGDYLDEGEGFEVLALVVERLTGTSFHDLVKTRVCDPAGMHDTAFLRSDELPARAARGYLRADGLRTNVLHLPVRGSGDGGLYSTVDDIHAFWPALFAGRIVPSSWVEEMLLPRSDVPEEARRYGLGFWRDQSTEAVLLEGYDAGVSFRSVHDPSTALTWTVVSNTSDGAWPVAQHLSETLAG